MKKVKAFYAKLPKEVKIFFEYILPAAVVTAAIDYFGTLEISNEYVLMFLNLFLIFLRNLKPRYDTYKN